jgi:hypothetical protein
MREGDMGDVTREEVRARAAVAGLTVSEEWMEMMRRLLTDALAPLRRADGHALRAVEPAVTFDAGGEEGPDDAGR